MIAYALVCLSFGFGSGQPDGPTRTTFRVAARLAESVRPDELRAEKSAGPFLVGSAIVGVTAPPLPARIPRLLAAAGRIPLEAAETFVLETAVGADTAGRTTFFFRQELGGLPVWDASLAAAVRDCGGRWLLWASWRAAHPNVRCVPARTGAPRNDTPRRAAETDRVVLLPDAAGLVETLMVRSAGGGPRDRALVFLDPATHTPLACYPLWRGFDGLLEALATPGLLPDLPANPAVALPLPHLVVAVEDDAGNELWRGIADEAGSFAAPVAPDTAWLVVEALRSPGLTVVSAAGDPLSLRQPLDRPVFRLNDPPGPAGTAQANVFIHIEKARSFVARYDPASPLLTRPLFARVEVGDLACNAVYGSGVFEFGAAGGDCAGAAFSTVIHHEFGHAVTDTAYGDLAPAVALDEGLADSFTVLLNGSPLVAQEFRPGEAGRDVSAVLYRWPQDAEREPHLAGLVVAGAWWDLRQELVGSMGEPAGVELARRLFFASVNRRPGTISPELGRLLLFLDDDDGDLANGTPHLPELVRGFGRHGLMPPPWQTVILTHRGVPDASLGAGPLVRLDVAGADLRSRPRVRFQVNGGPPRSFTLEEQAPRIYTGRFPPLVESGLVSYHLEAEDETGALVFSPYGAPRDRAWTFTVGRVTALLAEDFDGGGAGWESGAWSGADEWSIGPIGAPPGLWDPPAAASPPACAGMDLGGPGRDGDYRLQNFSFLRSPPVALPATKGRVLVRFMRWLTAGDGHEAWIEAEGRTAWTSGGALVADSGWTPSSVDLTDALPVGAAATQVSFILRAGAEGIPLGGWHIDDVRIELVTAEPSFVRGDADRSGSLEIQDAIRIVRAAAGVAAISCGDAADANDDGRVGLDDGILLLRYLFAAGPSPAEPFPGAGVDSTPDGLSCEAAPAP